MRRAKIPACNPWAAQPHRRIFFLPEEHVGTDNVVSKIMLAGSDLFQHGAGAGVEFGAARSKRLCQIPKLWKHLGILRHHQESDAALLRVEAGNFFFEKIWLLLNDAY